MKESNNIFKKIIQVIYGTEPAELSFDYPKDEAIKRLHSDLNKNECEAMVGRANADEVVIQRGRALFQPLISPIFIGSFQGGNQTTKLSGFFRTHLVSQLFVSLLAIFIVVAFLDGFADLITNPSGYDFFSLSFMTSILMILVALSAFSLLITRNDKEWLTKNISDAINKGA